MSASDKESEEVPPDLQNNFINDVLALKEALSQKNIFLTSKEEKEISQVSSVYPFRISRYYLSLIKEKFDPIWNQCIPRIEEITDDRGQPDPLCEESEISCLTHRYPDRALVLVSNSCATYCRFCTRKRKVGDMERTPSTEEFEKTAKYIEEHEEIRDVLLSGGDPLMLGTKKLKQIIDRIRKIPHVEMIRIGTRVPCTFPQRIINDPSLRQLLKKRNKDPALFINTHFEHPREITPESKLACEMLTDAGIPLGNQSIILKGVNDSPKIFSELNKKLLAIKVRPYYLYQPDLVKGTYHFIREVTLGQKIIDALRGHTTGMATPHLVIDTPGGHGKVLVSSGSTKISADGKKVKMKSYRGEDCEYSIESK